MPFGPPKSCFEKNLSKGWVPARGPPGQDRLKDYVIAGLERAKCSTWTSSPALQTSFPDGFTLLMCRLRFRG
jgi:hypothetical protein